MYNLTDVNVIKAILAKDNFRFSKSLGQNFLIDPEVCPRMAYECGAEGSGAVEIGPGIGVLTAELAKVAEKVVSIELDSRLIPLLNDTLRDFDNVKIINDDALKCDLKKIIEQEFPGEKICVCANLPYYITTPILMKLLESDLPLKSITVMVQKEAAQRICAKVGSRDGGAVTVAVNCYAETEKLFDVPRSSFMPSPKVDSCVIRLNIKDKKPVESENEEMFFAAVKAAFGQRRKTLVNSLSSGLGIPKDKIAGAVTACGLDCNIRAEALTMEDFINLTAELKAIS